MIIKIINSTCQILAKLNTKTQHNSLMDHAIVVSKPKELRNSDRIQIQRQKVTTTPPKKPIHQPNPENL